MSLLSTLGTLLKQLCLLLPCTTAPVLQELLVPMGHSPRPSPGTHTQVFCMNQPLSLGTDLGSVLSNSVLGALSAVPALSERWLCTPTSSAVSLAPPRAAQSMAVPESQCRETSSCLPCTLQTTSMKTVLLSTQTLHCSGPGLQHEAPIVRLRTFGLDPTVLPILEQAS